MRNRPLKTATDPVWIRRRRMLGAGPSILVATGCVSLASAACGGAPGPVTPLVGDTVRIALFNVRELSAAKLSDVGEDGSGRDPQLRAAAEIIRRVGPDILVLNEIDHYLGGDDRQLAFHAEEFRDRYIGTGPASPPFPHAFAAPNNTGRLSGLDLNGDGTVATEADLGTRTHGDDSFGYGEYPGQYSMAVLSRYPFGLDGLRTFQRLGWSELPGHHMPMDHFAEDVAAALRLSSKSHWDLPVQIGGTSLHLLLSHPTPPVFDGPEDKNGRRNFDEIRFWALYLDGGEPLRDDHGQAGGFSADELFVIGGDLNAQPASDQAVYDGMPAITQLLGHPRVRDTGAWLTSRGAVADRREGPPDFPEQATADFGGGARVDYLLADTALTVVDGGVYWPAEAEDPVGRELALAASDHRLIWLDVVVPPTL